MDKPMILVQRLSTMKHDIKISDTVFNVLHSFITSLPVPTVAMYSFHPFRSLNGSGAGPIFAMGGRHPWRI